MLNISCVNAYIDPNGKIWTIDDTSVEVVKNAGHTESSITVAGNQLSATGRPFDEIIETENDGTIKKDA